MSVSLKAAGECFESLYKLIMEKLPARENLHYEYKVFVLNKDI